MCCVCWCIQPGLVLDDFLRSVTVVAAGGTESHMSDHLGACDLVAASFSCDFCL